MTQKKIYIKITLVYGPTNDNNKPNLKIMQNYAQIKLLDRPKNQKNAPKYINCHNQHVI